MLVFKKSVVLVFFFLKLGKDLGQIAEVTVVLQKPSQMNPELG